MGVYMKYKDLQSILQSLGYYITRSTKHIIFNNGLKSVAVPNKKIINKFTAKQILNKIGYQKELS